MTFPDFTEDTIRALASDESFYRGEQYLEAGAVGDLILEGDTYRAHVRGTRRYTVRIRGSGDALETSCTCPYEWGGICKHVVAVMLSILRQEEKGQAVLAETMPVDQPPQNGSSVEHYRARLHLSIGLVYPMLGQQPPF